MMPGNGFAALDPCNPNIIGRRVPRPNPKNKITKRTQSDPLFSTKAQNESQLPAPGGGAEARPGCAARCNESLDNVTQNRGNGSWFQVSGVPTARLQSAN
jgi:hypothetical protein